VRFSEEEIGADSGSDDVGRVPAAVMRRSLEQDIPVEDLIFGPQEGRGDDDDGDIDSSSAGGTQTEAQQQFAAAAAAAGLAEQQREEGWEEDGAAELLESAASMDAEAAAAAAVAAVHAHTNGDVDALEEGSGQQAVEDNA
jgi:hypothetical protein